MLSEETELRNDHRYKILRLLSEKGGMGLVYQATDLNLRSTVVIKQSRYNDASLLRQVSPDLTLEQLRRQAEPLREAFEREARLLFNLRHIALPRALNYFEAEYGNQYFVMEFIPGKDFGELLALKGPFSLAQVLDWADQLLDVLDYLHTAFEHPIIHRDIKPQNLKLMPNNKIVLLDFGLAKGSHPNMTMVVDSVPGHTLQYSSLEQIGHTGTNERSDLYSLAVTLHQLLTGAMPPNAAARVNKEPDSDPLRPAHEINPRIPVAISEVLRRAAAAPAADRYASAAEMRRALRRAIKLAEAHHHSPPAELFAEISSIEEETLVNVRQRSFAQDLGAGADLEMVGIPGGSFAMGAPEGVGLDDERPQHSVKLAPFFIGKYPIIQAQWEAVMGNNPSRFKGADLPVDNVSWHDAQEFCRRLNQRTGTAYRLATEAEWEYACRAGLKTEYSIGDDESQLDQCAWYSQNSGYTTHPVGQKEPNAWGIYDMQGNVWEWCQDWYDEHYYEQSPGFSPPGPVAAKTRVLRGGSWSDDKYNCRATSRDSGDPFNRSASVGFRIALPARDRK